MPKRIRCGCRRNPDCKLCAGAGVYEYEPGPLGWMPFTCPTCEGRREMVVEGKTERCSTCSGAGSVDPANPPRDTSTKGFMRDIWRIFMGG
ncbi:hypothetical protein R5W24_005790 [Gemmata sp. JC717]|uniref:hypothetical protein n=1 Tax=Gemmata algarum TaxID=2975278 RepID=UPI0021BAC9BD|nr:hypothetical protein [Gemmata algarum]MDY3556622.1 hypothetical protein [Gemmata algarum]